MKARRAYRSLTARIAVLVPVTAIITLFGVIVLIFLLQTITGPLASHHWLQSELTILIGLVIVVGVPLLIGWFVARLVTKPLKEFEAAIVSLRASKYAEQLPPAGIREFDKVFAGFNELAKQLHVEESLRKDLISDTSHELNTPLTAIAGQLTAMQDDKLPITKERISMIKEQTDRLRELVDGLDAYTRARMPSTAHPEPIHLKRLCQRLIDELTLELKDKHMQTKLDIDEGLTIYADPKAVQQIAQNLLRNAVRYSEATAIIISASKDGLRFSDNGKGVPADSLSKLFERFYRVEQSRSRTTGGLGLGLAIVKELVERQGWSIRAEAAKPGLAFVIKF